MTVVLPENPYGVRKRFDWVSDIIIRHGPIRVLDVGCGTGAFLTFPLAARFPQIEFFGIDVDRPSVEFARTHHRAPNLTFAHVNDAPDVLFDLIVASEVIEHVEHPHEFLLSLTKKMSDQAKILVTVPNGHGPFEIMSLIEDALYVSGLLRFLRWLKRKAGLGVPRESLSDRDTLAVDPHINFFSFAGVRRLMAGAGLRLLQYRPRTFLCGFVLDYLLRGERLLTWNARIADALPPFMNSAWMFLVERQSAPTAWDDPPSVYARLHKYLNLKRWGLAATR